MGRLDEIASEQFTAWEERGRGYHIWPHPVAPEPPFRPFSGFRLPDPDVEIDDGRKPTLLSSLLSGLEKRLNPKPPVISQEPETEPEAEILERKPLIELRAVLPADFDARPEAVTAFLRQLSGCREPVAFELLGIHHRVCAQFAAHPDDVSLVRRQLQAHFPDAAFQTQVATLAPVWDSCDGEDVLLVEFGLKRQFMFTLESSKRDPFVGIVAALAELERGELGLFQVLFQSAQHPWAESIVRIVTDKDDNPIFENNQALTTAAETKISRPLYAVVVRIALKTAALERTQQLAYDLAASLSVFSDPQGNELIPLENDDYPFEAHVEDVLRRQSRRSGMLLNSDELIGFVHLPSSAVSSPVLARDAGKTKAAPAAARQTDGVLLGNNVHLGDSVAIRITTQQRLRHTHIIGASGTGKSTLLFNLVRQDIEHGEGVALLDPHGDLVEKILGVIPPERVEDVILIDPSDEQYSVGFNILNAHSDLEKNLLASDLVSIFQRLSASWGDQMGSVLQNAILAFLESPEGGTLSDLRRFLIEPAFREKVLKTVRDPDIVYYWRKAFPQLTGNRSIGPVLTRLDTFLSPKPIRYMVSQPVNRLDFGEILDTGKILLAKLSQGQIGKENSYLLGSLVLAKFQQLVMGRQVQRAESRRAFFLYADEFHNFITPSLAEILSGARKYGLGLILAHQELHQLERNSDVKSAVLSNPYTRVVFRVGDADARALEGGFSFFETKDFQNLETGQAICRVEKADGDFNLAVPFPEGIDPRQAEATRKAVIAASRAKYATPRSDVEAALSVKLQADDAQPQTPKPKPPTRAVQVSETNAAEVPKATGSEKEKSAVAPAEAAAVEAHEPTPAGAATGERQAPRDLGRGGEQHKSIQERLQKEAHALGFAAQIEKQLSKESKCAADLVLRQGDLAIAVEITVTTSTDHEFGNVKKCLAGGFARVAVISPSVERLRQIQAAVQAGLGAEAAAKVSYQSPDEFISELRKIAAEAAKSALPTPPAERMVSGWKVRRFGAALSEDQRKANEGNALNIMLSALRPNT